MSLHFQRCKVWASCLPLKQQRTSSSPLKKKDGLLCFKVEWAFRQVGCTYFRCCVYTRIYIMYVREMHGWTGLWLWWVTRMNNDDDEKGSNNPLGLLIPPPSHTTTNKATNSSTIQEQQEQVVIDFDFIIINNRRIKLPSVFLWRLDFKPCFSPWNLSLPAVLSSDFYYCFTKWFRQE